MVRTVEFPNEQIPADTGMVLPAAVKAAKKAPVPDWSGYPLVSKPTDKRKRSFWHWSEKVF
jgi:hypothetical protein